MRAKAVMALGLSWVMTLSLPHYEVPTSLTAALFFELLLGVALGLTVRMMMASIDFAGELASTQMGFGFNKTVDPLTKTSAGPITRIFTTVAGVLLFVSGGYHEILKGLALSLRTFPPGSMTFTLDYYQLVVVGGHTLISAGMRIALPLLIVAMLTQMTFGIMTKVAPQLNIWFLGFSFTIAVGFFAIIIFAPGLFVEINAQIERAVASAMDIVKP